MPRPSRIPAWTLLFLPLAALFHLPILLGAATFPPGDLTHHFLPISALLRDELAQGRLPLWNPYTYSGHPLLADPQTALFYPLGDLFLLWPGSSLASRLYALELETLFHLALAGAGTALFVHSLTRSRWAGLVAGITFAFSGYLTGYPPLQLAILRTGVWLPILMGLVRYTLAHPTRRRGWMGLALAGATAFLAGHGQTFLHLATALLSWTLFLLIRQWTGWRAALPRLLKLGLAALFALGLVTVQLWPSWEFTRLSVRASLDLATAGTGFPLQDAWQLLFPRALTHFAPQYISVVGLALALLALLTLPLDRRDRAPRLFFLGLALVAFWLSLGNEGGLFPLFYRWLPGWSLFRQQERLAYLTTFGLSVLAGYGLLSIQRLASPLPRRLALTVLLGFLAATAVFGLLWQMAGRTQLTHLAFLARAVFVLGIGGIFVGLVTWLRGRALGMALALLIFLDLALSLAGINLAPGRLEERVALPPEVQALQARIQAEEVGTAPPPRAFNEHRVFGDYGVAARVEDLWGESPLRLARYAALFQEFPLHRLWQLTGPGYVLTWREELFLPAQRLAAFPDAGPEGASTYLHRLEKAAPRARFVVATQAVDDAQALTLLADDALDLACTALLPAEASPLLPATPADMSAAGERGKPTCPTVPVQAQRLGPARWRIQVQAPQAGLLLLSENWMPGWQARVRRDGMVTRAPVYRANLTFLGAPLPAGESQVELIYRPASVYWGGLISLASLGSLLILAGWAWLSRRRQR